MEVVAHRIPFVEIPVNYRARVGESSVTGDLWKAFRLGMQMIALVLRYRLGFFRGSRTPWVDLQAIPRASTHTTTDFCRSDADLAELSKSVNQESVPVENRPAAGVVRR